MGACQSCGAMNELEMAIRLFGHIAAALGTCAAVPAATWRLVGRVQRLVRRVHDDVAVHPATIATKAGFGGPASGKVIHKTGGSPEQRIAQLEQRVLDLGEKQARIDTDLQKEIADRRRVDEELRTHVDLEVGRVNHALDQERLAAVEVDARALPVILFGSGLATFPDVLASNALVGTGAVALAIGLFLRAWYLLDLHPR